MAHTAIQVAHEQGLQTAPQEAPQAPVGAAAPSVIVDTPVVFPVTCTVEIVGGTFHPISKEPTYAIKWHSENAQWGKVTTNNGAYERLKMVSGGTVYGFSYYNGQAEVTASFFDGSDVPSAVCTDKDVVQTGM